MSIWFGELAILKCLRELGTHHIYKLHLLTLRVLSIWESPAHWNFMFTPEGIWSAKKQDLVYSMYKYKDCK